MPLELLDTHRPIEMFRQHLAQRIGGAQALREMTRVEDQCAVGQRLAVLQCRPAHADQREQQAADRVAAAHARALVEQRQPIFLGRAHEQGQRPVIEHVEEVAGRGVLVAQRFEQQPRVMAGQHPAHSAEAHHGHGQRGLAATLVQTDDFSRGKRHFHDGPQAQGLGARVIVGSDQARRRKSRIACRGGGRALEQAHRLNEFEALRSRAQRVDYSRVRSPALGSHVRKTPERPLTVAVKRVKALIEA